MNSLTGTGALVRLALRRDRIMVPVWIAIFVSTAAASASATAGLYPTLTARVAAAEAFNQTFALVAFYGRIYDPTSLGALAMLKAAGMGAFFVAVFTILIVVRHSRAEEETGRLELVGATVVGRVAPLTAALLVAVGVNLILALLTAGSLISAGLPADGSLAFGFAWAGVGFAFAAIAGLTAQLTRSARTATGSAVVILGVVYILRALGDTADVGGPRWLTWLSPIGWSQQLRPFAGNRWWILLITLGFTLTVATFAYALVKRRDFGAGLLADRPGPATAGAGLRSPLGLAWRLQRGSLLAWAGGFVLLGLVFGGIASNVAGFVDSPQAREMFAKLGGQKGLTDAFLATELGFVGAFASAYGVQAAMRLHAEETGLRSESILATATGRVGWAMSHIAIALSGTTALMVGVGLSAGIVHSAQVGDMGRVAAVLVGALVYLPVAWILTAIVVASFGVAPRLAAAGWVSLVVFLLLGEFGPLLELPQWLMDLSPFTHVPKLPGAAFTWTPLLVLTAIAAGLTLWGLGRLRRRDIPATS